MRCMRLCGTDNRWNIEILSVSDLISPLKPCSVCTLNGKERTNYDHAKSLWEIPIHATVAWQQTSLKMIITAKGKPQIIPSPWTRRVLQNIHDRERCGSRLSYDKKFMKNHSAYTSPSGFNLTLSESFNTYNVEKHKWQTLEFRMIIHERNVRRLMNIQKWKIN